MMTTMIAATDRMVMGHGGAEASVPPLSGGLLSEKLFAAVSRRHEVLKAEHEATWRAYMKRGGAGAQGLPIEELRRPVRRMSRLEKRCRQLRALLRGEGETVVVQSALVIRLGLAGDAGVVDLAVPRRSRFGASKVTWGVACAGGGA